MASSAEPSGCHREGGRLPLVEQSPYAPELNPVVYPTIAAKVDTVEVILHELNADPERVKRLIGWYWITDALSALPDTLAA